MCLEFNVVSHKILADDLLGEKQIYECYKKI